MNVLANGILIQVNPFNYFIWLLLEILFFVRYFIYLIGLPLTFLLFIIAIVTKNKRVKIIFFTVSALVFLGYLFTQLSGLFGTPNDFKTLKLTSIKEYESSVQNIQLNCPKAALVYSDAGKREILEVYSTIRFNDPYVSHYLIGSSGVKLLTGLTQTMDNKQIANPSFRNGNKFSSLQTSGAGGLSPNVVTYWLEDSSGVKLTQFEGTNSKVVYAGNSGGKDYFVIGKINEINRQCYLQLGYIK